MGLIEKFGLDPKSNEKPLMGLATHIFINSWLSHPLTWLSVLVLETQQ